MCLPAGGSGMVYWRCQPGTCQCLKGILARLSTISVLLVLSCHCIFAVGACMYLSNGGPLTWHEQNVIKSHGLSLYPGLLRSSDFQTGDLSKDVQADLELAQTGFCLLFFCSFAMHFHMAVSRAGQTAPRSSSCAQQFMHKHSDFSFVRMCRIAGGR